jgi:hypothetical protein
MKMIHLLKKYLIVFILFISHVCIIGADELADLLQDLAIQTACLGMYSSTEAGIRDNITNRYVDPPDWYTPPLMASRFAQMSGNMTRIETFYGVCFDYAQFAWNDIKSYQSIYIKAGMKEQQWYIAVTFPGDPNTIILYDPVSQERATRILNGVPVKEYTRYKVLAHDNATGHAWLWVQHKNGTWYWIDPTWTDNTGYPWWGIVKDGREVQYYPNRKYTIATNYPRPPSSKETQTERETRSPDSTYVSYSGKSNLMLFGYNFTNKMPIGLTLGLFHFYTSINVGIGDSGSSNYGDEEIEGQLDWLIGYAIPVNKYFLIPIGVGANILQNNQKFNIGASEWEHKIVLEVGIQAIYGIWYLSATYRLRGFSQSGFSIGTGFAFWRRKGS